MEEIVYRNELKEKVLEIIEELPPMRAEVIKLRFGLEDGRLRTLGEVGQIFGVTRERIRQIEAEALRKLRSNINVHKLKGLL